MGHMLTIVFRPLVGTPTEKQTGEIKSANSPRCPSHVPKGDSKDGKQKPLGLSNQLQP